MSDTDLAQEAAALYALPVEEFTAARDARAKELRAALDAKAWPYGAPSGQRSKGPCWAGGNIAGD
jgi:hypothetical protein